MYKNKVHVLQSSPESITSPLSKLKLPSSNRIQPNTNSSNTNPTMRFHSLSPTIILLLLALLPTVLYASFTCSGADRNLTERETELAQAKAAHSVAKMAVDDCRADYERFWVPVGEAVVRFVWHLVKGYVGGSE